MNRLILPLCASICLVIPAQVQSAPLPSDRGRVTVASIPDPYGGPNLKVLRTDSNTPLRAGTAWIWEKQGQEEPGSYFYNNDAAYATANNAANLRNLHSRYPGWPSENAFPPGTTPGAIGLDQWRSQPFPGDNYVNQTCERLGLGWSMWFINGQNQLDTNFPIMWADAVAKGWSWTPDVVTKTTLPHAASVPVVDGALDAAWSAASPKAIAISVLGAAAPASNVSGNWRAMWDASALYVFAEITDNSLTTDSGAAWYDDDSGGARERKLAWHGTSDNAYQNPSLFCTVALAPIPQSLSANIAALVQKIVNRPGWASGNAIAFLIRGSGHRTADAFDKAGGTPARLAVRYSLDTTSMSYNRWMSAPPVLTGGNALETADPDFDSLSNLMKFSQP